ncbi:prolyl oligopeptidase family serine peptidase [Pseudoclavibacter sp. RFBG4]|uniref:alpha/beta hydrolase family protein n=1 Tax=Pseudoclavibacter sp. RFBG4 TaxID=2080575 RepID=UPI0028007135|nr:prolyl oligopeptidase family serine peptidase [Pseudoclavibacter sp. RFBG4]
MCPADLRRSVVDEANEVTGLLGNSPSREALDDVSPITWITTHAPPVLIVHGTDDQIVEFAQGTALQDALRDANVPVAFREIANARHEWADTPPSMDSDSDLNFGTMTADFFDRVL